MGLASKLIVSSAFMMSLALVVSLITNFSDIFPSDILTAPVRSNLTVLLLAVMMTISLSRISSKSLSPLKNPRSLIRGLLLGLVISSLIPIAGYLILRNTEYADYAAGLVFIAATPFAASVAPLSFILRGDMEHALRSTIYVYIAALLWIPFIIFILAKDVVDMKDLVITVIEVIGVPLIVSRFLTKVKIDKQIMATVLNCIIFFLVWLSVSSTDFSIGIWIMLAFMLIVALRTFGLGCAVEVIEKRAGIGWSQRVTDILMMSYKNKGIAIALCVSTMAPPMIPLAMVAIASSIVIEICWVVFMDSVLFSRRRMKRELAKEGSEVGDL
ncbi:MAG: Na+-dependent transporter [Candidatus Methanoplasma sp.]|jgi:BASS family bile acid:Na+ symporter|nr:Na+-dependent transporter [Candidatus Methanoplasma sp.]